MAWQRRLSGGLLAVVGFMLSPLSWWNDAFVNLPLALGFAWIASASVDAGARETVFNVAVVIGYWLTNVLGFVLMHQGARGLRSPQEKAETKRELWKDLWISFGYTVAIVVPIKLGVLKPIHSYFVPS